MRARWVRWAVILGALFLAACGVIARPTPAVTPAPPEGTLPAPPTGMPTPLASPTLVILKPAVEPSPSATLPASPAAYPSAVASPQPTTTPPAGTMQMVYARLGTIFRGDAWGNDPQPMVDLADLETWDFSQGQLATAHGRLLTLLDLAHGTAQTVNIPLEGEVLDARLLWGEGGKGLLYMAIYEDPQTSPAGQSVALYAVNPQNGSILAHTTLKGLAGALLLRYDDSSQRVMLIPFGPDDRFTTLAEYDLQSGQATREMTIAGQGEAALSPDGRWLLTTFYDEAQGKQSLLLADVAAGHAPEAIWVHQPRTHSAAHLWSPDGQHVAYLLRDGLYEYESTRGLGLWILDVSRREARQVLDLPSPISSLVRWTPDGAYIVGYERDERGAGFYFAVRPDGGGYRILSLDPEAILLGWMPLSPANVPPLTLDPWPIRFAETRGDPSALAQRVAEYLSAHREEPLDAIGERLRSYMSDVGWEVPLGQPSLLRLNEDLVIAGLPPLTLYALEGATAYPLTSGQIVLDARLEGKDLGVIAGVIGASAVQPSFALLRRSEAGWQTVWVPQGQRDWIATDGEVRFLGEGLGRLEVRGTSFGLENEVFQECHACPHRLFVATWVRQGDAYVRQSRLPAGASLDEVYWEMTERTPYAVLDEFLRRARRGLEVKDLVTNTDVVATVQQLGLLAPEARFIAEREEGEAVYFTRVEGAPRYAAFVRGGKLVEVRQISP